MPLTKTRGDLTYQDFKNISQLLFKGRGYKPDTIYRMVQGAKTMAPVVDEAIDIYMTKQIKTALDLEKLSDKLLRKHGITSEMVEA